MDLVRAKPCVPLEQLYAFSLVLSNVDLFTSNFMQVRVFYL